MGALTALTACVFWDGGSDHAVARAGYLAVESGIRRLAVGAQGKVAEPKRQRAEDRPADEAELQAEETPAVALHHRFRGF